MVFRKEKGLLKDPRPGLFYEKIEKDHLTT